MQNGPHETLSTPDAGGEAVTRVGTRAQQASESWPDWLKRAVESHEKAFESEKKRNGDGDSSGMA